MVKLHKMTWGELQKHNSYADNRFSPNKIIPETYWFTTEDGDWYEVSKGAIGWNIYDEKGHNEGFAETLKEIRIGF